MGGNGVGLDSGGGSRGASFGGLGMRAIFSPFGLVHHKPDAQPRPRDGFGIVPRRGVDVLRFLLTLASLIARDIRQRASALVAPSPSSLWRRMALLQLMPGFMRGPLAIGRSLRRGANGTSLRRLDCGGRAEIHCFRSSSILERMYSTVKPKPLSSLRPGEGTT